MKKTISILFFSLAFLQCYSNHRHIIGSQGQGFFAEFIGVLQNISWCERKGKQPVAYWDEKSKYHEAGGFNGVDNAWEYYFEPVSGARYKHGDKIYRKYQEPDGRRIPYDNSGYIENSRVAMNSIIMRYIKIKPYVLDEVNDFYNKNMKNGIIIGIHLRGTDKVSEASPIKPMSAINKAKEFAELAKKLAPEKTVKFLVASDDQRLIDFAKKNLPEIVINYEASSRSVNGKPPHFAYEGIQKPKGFFACLGRDVLVEALLLAQCDFFVHTRSNVATGVLFFNSDLQHFLFDGYAKL